MITFSSNISLGFTFFHILFPNDNYIILYMQ